MKIVKSILNKFIYDGGICLALLMPELFPELSYSEGFRKAAIVLMLVVTVLAVLNVFLWSRSISLGEHYLKRKLLGEVNWAYKIYEPASDMALAICLIISGECSLAATYFLCGLFLRSLKYREIEMYKEEEKE